MSFLFRKMIGSREMDSFFILVLLCLFAFGSLLIVIFCINAYQSITDRLNDSYNQSMPLMYIASKVRQADSKDAVRIEDKEGTACLIISEAVEDEINETWIYSYNSCLYEIYVGKGTDFTLDDGNILFNEASVTIKMDSENRLTLYSYNHSSNPIELSLSLNAN